MSRRLALAAAGLLLGAAPAAAVAQGRPVLMLEPGTRVRVATGAAPERVVGTVQRSTRDSLHVLPSGAAAPVAFHLPEITSLEARSGRDRRRGALIGAGIGAGITVVFGGIDAAQGEVGGGEVALSVVGNALIVGLAGYLLAPRGWQHLPLPGPPPPGA